jgi:hypothetical protein
VGCFENSPLPGIKVDAASHHQSDWLQGALAAMRGAVSEEPIARFLNLPTQIRAAGPDRHKLRMVFPDQHHEAIRLGRERANQTPRAPFEMVSFRTVLRTKIHCGSSPGVQEDVLEMRTLV